MAIMQVVFRNLLAVSFLVWAASCALDDHGLGGTDARGGSAGSGSALTGGGGTSPTGVGGTGVSNGGGGTGTATAGATGSAGDGGVAGTTGSAGDSGNSGTSGAAGDPGAAGTGSSSGIAGTSGAAGTAAAAGTSGSAGTSGAAGTSAPGQIGCADGSREGYLDRVKYPKIAACSGAWEEAGLVSADSKTPQCDRRSGNDGDRIDGRGCSVADLCAAGWHVCESAKVVATHAASCADATAPFGDTAVFFVTRQRGTGLLCDDTQGGTNNLFGCGAGSNFGSAADKSCAPFSRMLRDSDCSSNFPWTCAEGPIGTSQNELGVVTKRGSGKGGALCCKDN
jgi:hypothetical protein